MSTKFLLEKRFSLDFLGNAWKENETFLRFNSFTISDVKNRLSKLGVVSENDQEGVSKALDQMIELLKDKFLSGQAIDETGKMVEVKAEDLVNLPVEVITKAISFLSQGLPGNE